jgi:hypothetical protein
MSAFYGTNDLYYTLFGNNSGKKMWEYVGEDHKLDLSDNKIYQPVQANIFSSYY